MPNDHKIYDTVKRMLDLASSSIGLLITAPLQIGIAISVRMVHGRPIFFRQSRPGKEGEIFELVKFRTMLEPDKNRTTDEERLTKFGRILRSTSLDELPTLWNVLKGDMSLIGPRPLLVSYLDLYSLEQARRHEVRPGVTGLAQVSGRNQVSWEEKFRLDVEYVDNRSLKLDLRILLKTVSAVLYRDGISQDGHVTMPHFSGSTRSEVNGGQS